VTQASDQWVFHHLADHAIYERGWGRLLRMAGYFPLWGLVAAALVLHDWMPRVRRTLRQGTRRGMLVFWSSALSGIIAEALKLVFRRERPGLTDGAHVFRAWSDRPLATSELGLPSSEAAVAFGAAAMLARLFPEARVLWYALATGCALTRVASAAHFMSDVVLGALVGYVLAVFLWHRSAAARGDATPEAADSA
jgi:membrane-associated phospholipid phosphatase